MKNRKNIGKNRISDDTAIFLMAAGFLSLLTGLTIPGMVIVFSPQEYMGLSDVNNPISYLLHTFVQSAGLFGLWGFVFFRLLSDKKRNILNCVFWCACVISMMDYLFFGRDFGMISPGLVYLVPPQYQTRDVVINTVAVIAALFLSVLIYIRFKKFLKYPLIILLLVAFFGFEISATVIIRDYNYVKSVKADLDENTVIHLDKNGKNVVVIMMDRMLGAFLPYLMYERPDLYDRLDGFTYYPNTVSFGGHTNFGSPGLYGGYEYTPREMNKRDDLLLYEKQNEALRVMPVMFSDNGYRVTVCDPTYAGYKWIPDIKIYDDRPEIKKYITMRREVMSEEDVKVLERNFFWYSVFKSAPVLMQMGIYDNGDYNISEKRAVDFTQSTESVSVAEGTDAVFLDSYNVLDSLPEMTEVGEAGENTFVMMSNDATHERNLLQEPDYVPSPRVDNREYDDANPRRYCEDGSYIDMSQYDLAAHYEINMAALLKLAEWFDYMRKKGVYDNTRIIIVSDHGTRLRRNPDMIMEYTDASDNNMSIDLEMFNCMLMVKDFDAKGFVTDQSFMTNADTPSLAMKGLLKDTVNPFTGANIDQGEIRKKKVFITGSSQHDTSENNGYRFKPDIWFSVHDNIFDRSNWEFEGVE